MFYLEKQNILYIPKRTKPILQLLFDTSSINKVIYT